MSERFLSQPADSKPGGLGLDRTAHPPTEGNIPDAGGELLGRRMSSAREATAKARGVAVAMVQEHNRVPIPSTEHEVNVGTLPPVPLLLEGMGPSPVDPGGGGRRVRSSPRFGKADHMAKGLSLIPQRSLMSI